MSHGFALRVVVAGLGLSLVLLGASMGDPQITGEAQAATQPRMVMLPLVSSNRPPTFSANSSAAPSPASAGSRVGLNVNVTHTSSGSSTGNIIIRVHDPLGNQVYQKQWAAQPFQANQTISLSDGYASALGSALGTYSVSLQVTSTDGGSTYYNDASTASFSLTASRAGFYGINWHPTWYDSTWSVNQLNLMQQAGVQRTRVDVNWDAFETSKGAYNTTRLASLDAAVSESAKRNIKPLLIVLRSPAWANGGQDPRTPPNNDQDYADFLKFLVARYAGTVNDYEIWNEPDGSWAWINPDAARYTALLKTAYVNAKSVNANVNILGGSLSGWYTNPANFLSGMYAAGARGYFDTLSAHAYGDPPQHGNLTPEAVFSKWSAAILPIMQANGDGAKRVWMTEDGYNTSTVGVSEATQADYLTRAYAAAKATSNVDALFYFEWMNSSGGTDITQPSQNYGIVTLGDAFKPSYSAYQSISKLP